MIEFRLDARSGVPAYLQLVHQVRQALSLGLLQPGDQLPTVKEVAARVAINPNTVLKAYRELDHEGLADGRRGQGTFVSSTVPAQPTANLVQLRAALGDWISLARTAGLEHESIAALMTATLQSVSSKEAA